ncbi:diguanylate cyclase domain-containing protein [Paenibacillus sp. 1011MAR3C5]|uniref:diguanylate cyclase domain-containing protein n=1 Tax=Paenibacillus sp. 1011MAR3C5 TaxID=1675787 RepID=UPI00160254F6|nr:diguanylate cyclase [Paenibacillus sp. 1011MAR3C5]
MGEIGLGLLHQGMIQSIRKQWAAGCGVAVLYLQGSPGYGDLDAIIMGNWQGEERRVFWRQRLEHEYYFLLRLRPGEQWSSHAAGRWTSLLRKRIAEAAMQKGSEAPAEGTGIGIGLCLALPAQDVMAETSVYRAMLAAKELSASESGHEKGRGDVHAGASLGAAARKGAASLVRPGVQTIGTLAAPITAIASYAHVSEASYVFDTDAHVPGIVVVRDGEPVGLLMREKLHQMLAGQYGLPLYWNRSVERIMDNQPLIVDESMPVERVSQLAMERSDFRLYDVVIITKNGQLKGAASVRAILECMTALRTEEARSANPLTGLPGNSGIQSELASRISGKRAFAMVYADMDFFKWFNDCFGFGLGDELIRYLADLMRGVFGKIGGSETFIGHIGGDDFIALSNPAQTEVACRELIGLFDQGVRQFYGGEEVTAVTDRSGHLIEQAGVSLSLSVLVWDGQAPVSPAMISQQAARLKKRAKSMRGSICMIGHLTEQQHREDTIDGEHTE